MRSRFVTLLTAAVLLLPVVAVAQDAAAPPTDSARAELMQRMMAAAQPGPEHARLAGLAGTYDVEITFFMGPEPTRLAAVAENRMILGGRFLESRTEGGEGPMHTEALAVYGFDRRSGRHTIVGYDTWGTYYVTGAGEWDEATRTAAMHGTDDDPIAGHTQVYTMNLQIVDADTYVTSVVFTDAAHTGGKGPYKAFEAVHRRRQAP